MYKYLKEKRALSERKEDNNSDSDENANKAQRLCPSQIMEEIEQHESALVDQAFDYLQSVGDSPLEQDDP